ncbi:MAG TPA: hypothetical protein VKB80_08820 [Kofleriaceae bacterium]|nr:hypothetical protein [Kofleriaceae bacterium]
MPTSWLVWCAAATAVTAACGSTAQPGAPTQPAPPPVTRSAEPAPPGEPPAARQFAAWLEAFNSHDRARLAAYHERSFPADGKNLPSVDDELGFAQQVGGFIVKKTEESTPTRFVAILQERASEQHARAELEVDPAPPHRVRKLSLNAIATPEDLRPPRLSEADALAALRAEVERAVAADEFSGAVLVARRGVPIFAEAYGLADRDAKIPNSKRPGAVDARGRDAELAAEGAREVAVGREAGRQRDVGEAAGAAAQLEECDSQADAREPAVDGLAGHGAEHPAGVERGCVAQPGDRLEGEPLGEPGRDDVLDLL